MAFRGKREAVEAYKKFKAKITSVDVVLDDDDNIRYYVVQLEDGRLVNIAEKGVSLLKQRYDFDDIEDIINQELEFWYTKQKDVSYGEYQLSFVFDIEVKTTSATQTTKKRKLGAN